MDFKTMTAEELLERRSAIAVEVEEDGADLDALEAEVKSINEELEARKEAEAQKAEIRAEVANGAGEIRESIPTEEVKKMTLEEIRSSHEYNVAYANYIKTEDDRECRALLTENVSGDLPVPSYVEGRIRTAWQKNGLMDLVRKTYIRGNLKVGFELSATAATVHTESTSPIAEETLPSVSSIWSRLPSRSSSEFLTKRWISAARSSSTTSMTNSHIRSPRRRRAN